MQILSKICLLCLCIIATSCNSIKHEYPKTKEERNREEMGSILGEKGLKTFFKIPNKDNSTDNKHNSSAKNNTE